MGPGAPVDLRRPPPDLDDLVPWLEAWSLRLVLLEEYPLHDLEGAVAATGRAVELHGIEAERWLTSLGRVDPPTSAAVTVLSNDHRWFATSCEQFRWFLGVVEQEDHGGHRQALGQYGRVFAEALRRHRRDERAVEAHTRVVKQPPVP